MLVQVLTVVFVVLAVLIVIKFLHHLLKAAFLVAALLAIILIVFGVFVVLDARDFAQHLTVDKSRFAYTRNGSLILFLDVEPANLSKVSSGGGGIGGVLDFPTGITVLPLAQAQKDFAKKDFQAMRADDYRLFIINDDFFDTLTLQDTGSGSMKVSGQELRELLHSDDPLGFYISSVLGVTDKTQLTQIERETIASDPQAPDKARALAFMFLFGEATSSKNLPELFLGVRSNLVQIEPRTALVDALTFTPLAIVNIATSNLKSGAQSVESGISGAPASTQS